MAAGTGGRTLAEEIGLGLLLALGGALIGEGVREGVKALRKANKPERSHKKRKRARAHA